MLLLLLLVVIAPLHASHTRPDHLYVDSAPPYSLAEETAHLKRAYLYAMMRLLEHDKLNDQALIELWDNETQEVRLATTDDYRIHLPAPGSYHIDTPTPYPYYYLAETFEHQHEPRHLVKVYLREGIRRPAERKRLGIIRSELKKIYQRAANVFLTQKRQLELLSIFHAFWGTEPVSYFLTLIEDQRGYFDNKLRATTFSYSNKGPIMQKSPLWEKMITKTKEQTQEFTIVPSVGWHRPTGTILCALMCTEVHVSAQIHIKGKITKHEPLELIQKYAIQLSRCAHELDACKNMTI